ncbi:MAG: ATP-dependent RecD-like DNA helicase [Alphaproteobacteria bacterium]
MSRLTGIVERVAFRNEQSGWAILQLRTDKAGKLDTLVGEAPPVAVGDTVEAEGDWVIDPSWGRQFKASRVTAGPPAGADGIAAYLGSGIVKGIGRGLAARLTAHFGEAIVDILERAPERLAEVNGVTPKLAEELGCAWREQKGVRETMLFLHEHGLPAGRAKKIWQAYKERTIPVLKRDPYALARDVQGFGFVTADQLAKQLGIDTDAPERHRAGLRHVLEEATGQGHTGVPRDEAARALAQLTGADEAAFAAALDALEGQKGVVVAAGVLYPQPLAGQEERIAERIKALAAKGPPWPPVDAAARLDKAEAALGVALSVSQRAAARKLLGTRFAVLTGGPGTGKTTLVRTLLEAVPLAADKVALAAPTGRAAKRLAESTERDAKTLHRLLEAEPGRRFHRGPGRPVDAELIVVDEASMIDVTLMDALLAALDEDAGLWLVGDVDQLPSVGPGRVLGDLIDSGAVAVVRLEEIFRQAEASLIVRNAHRINAGEMPETENGDDLVDFYAVAVKDAEDAHDKLTTLVAERMPARFGLDPMDDVQVLCPTNRGVVGARTLNDVLRARLNPTPADAIERGERRFAVHDRVMQIENDYERDVYNGDLGRLARIDRDQKTVEVRIDGRSLTYRFDELDALQPAYAVTVHKAQGSEYPAVVIVLARQHGRMLRRDLVYTGLTRARRLAVLLVEGDALERALRGRRDARRLTRLQELIEETS